MTTKEILKENAELKAENKQLRAEVRQLAWLQIAQIKAGGKSSEPAKPSRPDVLSGGRGR